jgi:ankyrin repeat protein
MMAKDNDGWLPIHYAAMFGNLEACRLLLERGDVELQIASLSTSGYAPFDLAAAYGQESTLEYLLGAGSELINHKNTDGFAAVHLAQTGGHDGCIKILAKHGATVSSRGPRLKTPLHAAARDGQLSTVQTLLDLGAEADAVDDVEATPLHYACCMTRRP